MVSKVKVFRKYILRHVSGDLHTPANPSSSDIIDSTPATGDIYKMLLESFVEEYDVDEREAPEEDHGKS